MSQKQSKSFNMSAVISATRKAAEKIIGKENVYVAAEHDSKQVGFPIPTFALRYLINSTMWPLQRITSCGGPPKGHKSSFAYQLQRWVLDAGGMVVHIETENKASSDIQRSLVGPKYISEQAEAEDKERIMYYNSRTLNEWQRILSDNHAAIKAAAASGGAKPNFPIMWNIDTLMGSDTEEAIEKLQEAGETKGRGFGDAAIMISQHLRAVSSSQLMGWPIFMHLTQQEKPALSGLGKTRAGGLAPDFYSSLDLQFSIGGTSAYSNSFKIERADVKGFNVKLKVRKSSIGPCEREIVVPFVWRFIVEEVEPVTLQDQVDAGLTVPRSNNVSQVFEWDWNAATSDLLANALKKDLKHILNVEAEQKRGGKVYYSSEAGVSASDPLSGSEFGALIESNQELVRAIELALAVKQTNNVKDGYIS